MVLVCIYSNSILTQPDKMKDSHKTNQEARETQLGLELLSFSFDFAVWFS